MRTIFIVLVLSFWCWGIEYFEASGQTCGFSLAPGQKAAWCGGLGTKVANKPVKILLTRSIVAKPNPFNSNINLCWTQNLNELASIAIYDISGRLVTKMAQTPKNYFIWNASGVPSGIYTVVVLTGKNRLSQRITLVK